MARLLRLIVFSFSSSSFPFLRGVVGQSSAGSWSDQLLQVDQSSSSSSWALDDDSSSSSWGQLQPGGQISPYTALRVCRRTLV